MSARSCQPRASLEASRRGRNPDSHQGHVDLALRFALSVHPAGRSAPAGRTSSDPAGDPHRQRQGHSLPCSGRWGGPDQAGRHIGQALTAGTHYPGAAARQLGAAATPQSGPLGPCWHLPSARVHSRIRIRIRHSTGPPHTASSDLRPLWDRQRRPGQHKRDHQRWHRLRATQPLPP